MHRNDLYKSLRKTKQDIVQSVWFILKMMKIMVLRPDDKYS